MRALPLLALAGCATFEDPTLVIDLRVLAIEAEPPEQLLEIDPAMPPSLDELMLQLRSTTIRALIAEPGRNGDLAWTMTACILDEGGRCAADGPQLAIADGIAPDPEHASLVSGCLGGAPVELGGVVCGRLDPTPALGLLLYDAFRADPARGIGGIDFGISLHVEGIGPAPIAEAFASKRLRVAPRIPDERTANANPHIVRLLRGVGGGAGVDLFRQHCASFPPDDVGVRSGQRVTLFPVADEGDREKYVLPTLDGQTQELTEYLAYQWLAMSGSFSDALTGGPPDAFGNLSLDGSDWTAPAVNAPTDVSLWVIQRDGRNGVTWREACIRVLP